MRCSINPGKCEFASNMKDRPNSRCLKYVDAADCSIWCRARKNQSRKGKLKDIKEKISNYDFTSKVMEYLHNNQPSHI